MYPKAVYLFILGHKPFVSRIIKDLYFFFCLVVIWEKQQCLFIKLENPSIYQTANLHIVKYRQLIELTQKFNNY